MEDLARDVGPAGWERGDGKGPDPLGGATVKAIARGADHACAILTSGAVRCWGANASGQLGDGTFLNTREWRYAGYFNLITERVDEQWVTAGRREVEQRDPSGQRFLYKDRLAVLDVTLDDHGSVRNVRVVRSTGVDFLDRVAIDMFRRAETFANPPRGIIDARGQINFAFGINFVGDGLRDALDPRSTRHL